MAWYFIQKYERNHNTKKFLPDYVGIIMYRFSHTFFIRDMSFQKFISCMSALYISQHDIPIETHLSLYIAEIHLQQWTYRITQLTWEKLDRRCSA